MSVLFATAVFILMAAAPFVVIAVVLAAVAYGAVVLVRGLAGGQAGRAAAGAVVLAGGVSAGLLLNHWATTEPPHGAAPGAHALFHGAWRSTTLRFMALRAIADGSLQRLADEQRRAMEAPRQP